MTPTNSNRVLILFALLLAAGIGAMGYFSQWDNAVELPATTATGAPTNADTAGWQTYANSAFGFSLKYPSEWQLSESGIHTATPYIALGNPIEGHETYAMRIWVVSTKTVATAADYVKKLLKDDAAQDAANTKNGPAPQITPRFNDQYPVKAGAYDGYELFNVFEFDHNAEQVYVANGNEVLVFEFPIAAANPNLSLPMQNNAVAHAILDTLQLSQPAGAFCGGIAAFPCPSGYACKLDGTYPDAGGHCQLK